MKRWCTPVVEWAKGFSGQTDGWTLSMGNSRKQDEYGLNGTDCGVFLLANAWSILFGGEMASANDIPSIRRRLTIMLLETQQFDKKLAPYLIVPVKTASDDAWGLAIVDRVKNRKLLFGAATGDSVALARCLQLYGATGDEEEIVVRSERPFDAFSMLWRIESALCELRGSTSDSEERYPVADGYAAHVAEVLSNPRRWVPHLRSS